MAELQVIINDRDVRRLLTTAPGQITEALRLGTEDTTLYWQRLVKTYPAQRTSTYRRTGTLGRSWTSPDSRRVEVVGTTVQGRVSSSGYIAPYNRYVQDEELQARVHQGTWETIQAVMGRTASQVERFYEDRLRVVANR